MTARSWSPDRAAKRIEARLNEVVDVEIKEYVRDTNLNGLGQGKAYRVHGVHLYVDILNMQDLLGTTASEGETSHKRTLRFLNLHFRAIHRILGEIDAIEVDIHNQRLHAVIAKPYGDEAARIHRAVAAGQLIIEVLAQTGESGDEIIPAAKVRVGIDSGVALAVRNGRRGHSEPLFLGIPANHAAKRAGGGSAEGIYLTNNARNVVGWPTVTSEDVVSLTATQISQSRIGCRVGRHGQPNRPFLGERSRGKSDWQVRLYRAHATLREPRSRNAVSGELKAARCPIHLRRYRRIYILRRSPRQRRQ